MTKLEKSLLRNTYESIAGVVSDRQWRRIRQQIGVEGQAEEMTASVGTINDMRAYALLRKKYPRSEIDPLDISRYKTFLEHFPFDGCEGEDLLKGIQKVLKPAPDDRTIRGWGYQLKCPLYLRRWYDKEDLNLWVGKMLTQRRFRVDMALPKCKQAQAFF